MTTFTLAQLTTPLTRAEVQTSIYRVIAKLGVNTTAWKPGAVVRAMVVGTSVVLAAFSELTADVARSGFLELSEGPWLKLVAWHVYGVQAIEATFATGQVHLSNTAGGLYEFDPGDLVVANTATGKTYRNAAAFTLEPLGVAVVDVIATEAGSASSADAEQITTIVSTLIGVQCTNPVGVTGLDDESDNALRLRCAEKLGALSPMGPWDAYSSAVRNAKRADGQPVAINRVKIDKDGFGRVYVYCASVDGPVTAGDLAIAATAVDEWATPQAVTSEVIGATARPVNIDASVWIYTTAGMSTLEIQDAITERLRAFFASQPVGGNVIGTNPGKVFADALRAAIASAVAPQIFHVTLAGPAGDVELAATEVATLGGTVALTITPVDPAEGFSP